MIDVEALERLANSTGPQTDLEIRYSVSEFREVVTSSSVVTVKVS